MISNKHKYTFKRGVVFLLAPFYTLVSFFAKKNNNIVLTSSLNNEFSDNSKAMFEILYGKPEYRDRIFFVLNDDLLRSEMNATYPGKFIENKSFSGCFFILKAGFWFCSAFEMPAPGFFQRFFRKVYHLGHGMPLKKFGFLESEISWYKKLYYFFVTSNISFSVITADFFSDYIGIGYKLSNKRLIKIPQPKTLQIAHPESVSSVFLSDKKNTNILYAPTWRPYTKVDIFPLQGFEYEKLADFLEKNLIHIWIRVHPRFEQELDSDIFHSENIHLFSSCDYKEVNSYLDYFDGLITDYSSIYYDFLTLERPVLFFDYDLEEYNKTVGVIDRFNEVKCTETTISLRQFEKQLLDIKNGLFDLNKIQSINKYVNYPVANEKIAEVVLDMLELN